MFAAQVTVHAGDALPLVGVDVGTALGLVVEVMGVDVGAALGLAVGLTVAVETVGAVGAVVGDEGAVVAPVFAGHRVIV